MFITIVICTVNCVLAVVMMIIHERTGSTGAQRSQSTLIVILPFVVKLGQAICDPVLYAFKHPSIRAKTIFAYPYSRIRGTTESLNRSSESRIHSSFLFKKVKIVVIQEVILSLKEKGVMIIFLLYRHGLVRWKIVWSVFNNVLSST